MKLQELKKILTEFSNLGTFQKIEVLSLLNGETPLTIRGDTKMFISYLARSGRLTGTPKFTTDKTINEEAEKILDWMAEKY